MDGIFLLESRDNYETLLGVVIQPNLKWDKQVLELLAKLKKRIAALANLKFDLSYNMRKVVSEGLVQQCSWILSATIRGVVIWRSGDIFRFCKTKWHR